MTHSGLTAADWTAIGTLALAGVTAAAVIIGQIQAGRDRKRADAERLTEIKRDDDRRADDRARDDERRAEDRARDDKRRAEDRERDDRLRRAAAEQRDRRDAAAVRSREDLEARQVLVVVEQAEHPRLSEFTHYITVSAPRHYQMK